MEIIKAVPHFSSQRTQGIPQTPFLFETWVRSNTEVPTSERCLVSSLLALGLHGAKMNAMSIESFFFFMLVVRITFYLLLFFVCFSPIPPLIIVFLYDLKCPNMKWKSGMHQGLME